MHPIIRFIIDFIYVSFKNANKYSLVDSFIFMQIKNNLKQLIFCELKKVIIYVLYNYFNNVSLNNAKYLIVYS